MAKFYGIIGYVESVETIPGVWVDEVVERPYSGDLVRNYEKHESSGEVNDNINIANEISIVADPYATDHFFSIRYVKFLLPKLGGVWKVTTAEVAYPRLILSIGGVYNGKQAGTTNKT